MLRAVPRVDRGEFVNVGVIIYCQELDFLRAAVAVDDVRLRALAADVDLEAVRIAAEAVVEACRAAGRHRPRERRTGHPLRHADRPAQHRAPALARARRRHRQPGAHPAPADEQAGGSGRLSLAEP